ncbi:MAG TPA: alpha-L-arabinofuranosidase C-terminal domain-containing protein [Candidatus Lokiarchaeia archaeon]|nr:alpha-L-arabinofuranosidase C-terminal domain-containing protein [Candidatus Lokiarchaeia archaeon]
MNTVPQGSADASLTIKGSDSDIIVKREILGQFIEHLGLCIENGIWTYDQSTKEMLEPPLDRVRKDLFDAIDALHVPLLRWPGGCFSDTYHWKDGIGPREHRPKRKNRAWGGIKNIIGPLGPEERNHFGTDEFITLCEKLGTKAMINVNYGSGTPEEAAEWVQHVGGTRAPIWGIANEIYGWWETGHAKTPDDYARRYLEFVTPMKAADPTIKLLAVGHNWNSNWNRTVLAGIKGNVDYLSIHLYFQNPNPLKLISKNPIPRTETMYYCEINSSRAYERLIEQTEADIDAVYVGATDKCKIAFDEWNIWTSFKQIVRADTPSYNLVDGLWCALIINLLIRHTARIGIANYAQLVNVIGLILTYDDVIVLTPQYHVFKLFGDLMQERLMQIAVTCDLVASKKFTNEFPAESAPTIDAAATISDDGNTIAVFVINKHFKESRRVTINFNENVDKRSLSNGTAWILTHDDPFAANTRENPQEIALQEFAIQASTPLTFDIPAHSLIGIRLQLQ